jgi:NTP pyrophosphatase (non-canonical NTP hydrolase)
MIRSEEFMTFEQYEEDMKRTAAAIEFKPESLCGGALGIAGEAGEVADYIKKVVYHGHDFSKEKLAEELGDVLWYLSYLTALSGYSLSDIAKMNIEKLRKRYPNGWDKQRSINR